jgi:hypothetical protein
LQVERKTSPARRCGLIVYPSLSIGAAFSCRGRGQWQQRLRSTQKAGLSVTIEFMSVIEPATERAARAFLDRVARHYDVAKAILCGSRARGDYRSGRGLSEPEQTETPGRAAFPPSRQRQLFGASTMLDPKAIEEAVGRAVAAAHAPSRVIARLRMER